MRKLMLGAMTLALVGGAVALFWLLRADDRPAPVAEKSTPARPRTGARPAPAAARATLPAGGPTFTVDKDPKGPLRLEGQLLGDGDLPVGGATVTISANPRRKARTEADGSFAFDHLLARTYRIWARAGDRVGGSVMHQLTATSEPVVLRLRQGSTLAVTVTAAGKPLAGASVKLRTADRQQATTDEQGQATIQGVREGGKLVTASAPGHAMAQELVFVPRGSKTPVQVSLALVQGVPVSGRVLDQAGAPVARAQVSAREMSDIRSSFFRRGRERVKTDDQGRFKIQALAPGTYRLEARYKQHAPGHSKPLVVGASPVGGVLISLPSGAVVSGRVLTPAGQPVPWAAVRTGPGEPAGRAGMAGRFRRATADKQGAFRIAGLPREKMSVAASSETGSSEVVKLDLSARKQVQDLVLTLSLKGIIAGVVVDGAGEPVPEAQVSAMPDVFARGALQQLYLRGLGGQMTDSGGRFKFQGLPEGAYRLRASRSGISRRMYRMLKGVEARTGDTGVRLVLQQPGGIKGTVQDQRGRPVTTYTVTVDEPPGTPVVDDQGRFQVRAIPPGTHDVTVRSPGHAVLTKKGVAVSASQTTDLGTLTLNRGRAVSGRVLDGKGSPVAGAEVVVGKKIVGDGKSLVASFGRAFEEASGIRRTQSDEDGSFVVAGIASSPQLIVADHPRAGRSRAAAVPTGDEDARMDLVLQPMGSLHGSVTYGSKPAPGVMVVVTQQGSRNQSLLVTTDSEGLYLVQRVPAGPHNLMAMSRSGLGGKSAGAQVTIKAGQQARADIHVEAGEITLDVKVLGQGGAVIPLAQVFVFKGGVSPKTGKQVQEVFLGLAKSGGAMMGFAKAGQAARFKQVTPAAYSLCVLPINGDIHDASFRARLQKHSDRLRVHCRAQTVPGSPEEQTVTVTSPPMDPLPEESK